MINISDLPKIINLITLLRNKRVAIVGNAHSIFEKQNGKIIYDHDIIIRFNRGAVDLNRAVQGTRTDILVKAHDKILTLNEELSINPKIISYRLDKYAKEGQYNIGNIFLNRLQEYFNLGKKPSTGFAMIYIAILAGADISLFGFDFGKTKTFYNADNYITPHNYKREGYLTDLWAKEGKVRIY